MAQILDSGSGVVYPTTPTGAYLANISIRHTVADAAASAVFAMRNPVGSGKTAAIRSIRGRMIFDGTAVAAANCGYEFIRFSAGDPTTGTTVPRIKKRNSYAVSVIADANAQQKSGVLTMTSVVYEAGPFAVVRLPAAVTNGVSTFDIVFAQAGVAYEPFELAAGEGLAIRLHSTAAIVGLGITGAVEWDER